MPRVWPTITWSPGYPGRPLAKQRAAMTAMTAITATPAMTATPALPATTPAATAAPLRPVTTPATRTYEPVHALSRAVRRAALGDGDERYGDFDSYASLALANAR